MSPVRVHPSPAAADDVDALQVLGPACGQKAKLDYDSESNLGIGFLFAVHSDLIVGNTQY